MSATYTYRCPKCNGTSLGVHVLATAVLHPDGSTSPSDDKPEFDSNYTAWCNDCGHCDSSASFCFEVTA